MMKTCAIRLRPGDDPKAALDALAAHHAWEAASVLTCVGSLTRAVLRFANQEEPVTLAGHFEIVSLTGLFSRHGGHYHIAISDGEGRTYGAHLMDGSAIYTTAEILLAVLDDARFLRSFDPATGYEELDIQPTAWKGSPDVSHP
jgi:predicted DNA-binding protein with PD1-like motif